jgi:hypothetical protein
VGIRASMMMVMMGIALRLFRVMRFFMAFLNLFLMPWFLMAAF